MGTGGAGSGGGGAAGGGGAQRVLAASGQTQDARARARLRRGLAEFGFTATSANVREEAARIKARTGYDLAGMRRAALHMGASARFIGEQLRQGAGGGRNALRATMVRDPRIVGAMTSARESLGVDRLGTSRAAATAFTNARFSSAIEESLRTGRTVTMRSGRLSARVSPSGLDTAGGPDPSIVDWSRR